MITITLTDEELANPLTALNLLHILATRTELIMASIAEIRAAAAQEKADVAAKVAALEQQIQDLIAAQAGGVLVSAADLEAVLADVQGILA